MPTLSALPKGEGQDGGYISPSREEIQSLCEGVNAAGGVLAKGCGAYALEPYKEDGSLELTVYADEITPWEPKRPEEAQRRSQ